VLKLNEKKCDLQEEAHVHFMKENTPVNIEADDPIECMSPATPSSLWRDPDESLNTKGEISNIDKIYNQVLEEGKKVNESLKTVNNKVLTMGKGFLSFF
jgi:hypothetical protein